MQFLSDNAGPVHPRVMEALVAANAGHAPGYGADPLSEAAVARIRDVFEAPEAAVYLVPTGTAANALTLAALTQPWETVFCTAMAHIHEDECNAPEFFTGGAKLTLVPSAEARMTPEGLAAAIAAEGNRGVHGPQRGPVSITQVTEKGTLYSLEQIAALTGIARAHGLRTHMDGARFANAMVALGCTAAEMTWKAGVDAVSFGGTKNGLMAVEAAVIFDPALARSFELRRKRAAHLFSKHRYLAAQMVAYLDNDLWREMARAANARSARLALGLSALAEVEILYQPQANMIFCSFPLAMHERARAAGAAYARYDDGSGPRVTARLVCDWSTEDEDVDAFLDCLRA